ncbi:MAG: cupin domain-containing protein [Rhizomicrobium sp.]
MEMRMQSAHANRSPAAQANGDAQQSAAPFRFLDHVALRTLLSPFSEEEFRTQYWERKPLVISRNNPGYYGDLFTLEDFDETIMRAPHYVKVAEATQNKTARHHGTSAKSRERVLADMREGSTLVLDGVQQSNPNLGLMCRELSKELGYGFQTNLYLTPPNGKGFTPHWDNHDVFVLQVVGSKHWKVENERRLLPEKEAVTPEEDRAFKGEVTSFTLEQGDMVYIPRGFLHAAECGSESSLHITAGIYPSEWCDLLVAIVNAATRQDEKLRAFLPMGFLSTGREEVADRVMAALRGMIDREFLQQVVDMYRNDIVKGFPLDVSGQVTSFFRPAPLTLDDQVRPRAGTVYTINTAADSVSIYVGARTVTFPGFFGAALDFALKTPRYAVRDLPGDLEDEEKLAFAERVMQEGLIVRK